MALSGSVSSSSYGQKHIVLSWSATQSVANNTSEISWTLKGAGGDSNIYHMAGGFKVVIDGDTVFSKPTDYRIQLFPNTVVASGKKTITHNADGTRSFSIYIEAGIYAFAVNCSGSGTFTLNTIPRASSISFNNFKMGTAGSITINRASTSFTHTISYAFGNSSGTICDKTTAGSVSWTPAKNLAEQIPSSADGTGTFTIYTYSGSSMIGSKSYNFKLTVADDCVPSIGSFTAQPYDCVTADWGSYYVVGDAKCKLTMGSISKAYGSDIKSYTIKEGNLVLSNSTTAVTNTIPTYGEHTFTAIVTDARGKSGTATVKINVEKYTAPKITECSVSRCNSDGLVTDDGEYARCLCVYSWGSYGGHNQAGGSYNYRKVGETKWGSAGNFTNGNDFIIDVTKFDLDSSYEIRFYVWDSFKSSEQIVVLSTAFVTMDLKDGGHGIAFGKVAETDDLMDVGFDARFRKSLKLEEEINGSNVPLAYTIDNAPSFYDVYSALPSIIGTFYSGKTLQSVISVRHRNGMGDGQNYGLMIRSALTDDTPLVYRKQMGSSGWGNPRVILDNENYFDYAARKSDVDALKKDSGWNTLWSNGTGYVKYRKFGPIVFVVGEANGEAGPSGNGWLNLGTLPSGYRPSYTVIGMGTPRNTSGYEIQYNIEKDGRVQLYNMNPNTGSVSSYWAFNSCFITG